MPVDRVYWGSPDRESVRDIHVLPGAAKAFQLDEYLMAQQGAFAAFPVSQRASHPSAEITAVSFATNVVASAATTGVNFDTATGKIEVTTGANGWQTKSPRLWNFIVTATVVAANGTKTHKIRVHLHEELKRVWLTPSELHIHVNAQHTRFGLRGEFISALVPLPVVADLSDYPGVTWFADAVWAPLDTTLGTIKPTTSDLGFTRQISVSMPARMTPTDPIVPVTARFKPAWNTLPATLKHAAGSARKPVTEVKNFLFLPDGFVNGEEPAFIGRVNKFLEQVATMPVLRPWNMLRGRANVFTAFVASQETGSSLRCAVAEPGGDVLMVPNPMEPPASVAQANWSLEQLIYACGMAHPEDLLREYATQKPAWQTLYGKGSGVTATLYDAWKNRAIWVVPDDRDTALGMAVAPPMSVLEPPASTRLNLHEFRANEDDIYSWINTLNIGTNHPAVGTRWMFGGAEEMQVVVLVKGAPHSGTRGWFIASALTDDTTIKVTHPTPGSSQARYLPLPYGTYHSARTVATITHELGHHFNLGDEYGGFPGALPADQVADVEGYLNLQTRGTLFTANQFQGANLKWARPQWMRLEACVVCAGVMKLPLTELTMVTLRPGDETMFAVGDVVNLRHRDIFAASPPATGWFSPPMKVMEKGTPPNRHVLTLAWDPPRTDTSTQLAPFTGSPTVLVRIRRRSLFGARPVVHPSILAHLTATDFALNVSAARRNPPPGGPVIQCVNDQTAGANHQTPLNLPDPFLLPTRFKSWTVGIYEGGARYSCEVYHPAGACAMNGTTIQTGRVLKGFPYRFCAVCRYVLAEKLDPTLHEAIDKEYETFYPVP